MKNKILMVYLIIVILLLFTFFFAEVVSEVQTNKVKQTEQFGAEQFHIQLTSIAQKTPVP